MIARKISLEWRGRFFFRDYKIRINIFLRLCYETNFISDSIMGQNGQIPSILEIFCKKTLFRKKIVIYHFFWYSSLVSSSTIFFNPPWHDDMESLIKKIKLAPQYSSFVGSSTVSGTRVHQARVPLCTGHLFFLNITPYSLNFLKPSLPTFPQLLSHHSLSQSPSHSLNFAINSL